MRTEISSRWTFAMKYVIPVLWGGAWCYATALLFTDPGAIRWGDGSTPAPPWAKWVFLGALGVAAWLFGRTSFRLKRVQLERGTLYVSNYWRELALPVSAMAAVGLSERFTLNDVPLGLIELRHETAFGRFIDFLPASEEAYDILRAALPARASTAATESVASVA